MSVLDHPGASSPELNSLVSSTQTVLDHYQESAKSSCKSQDDYRVGTTTTTSLHSWKGFQKVAGAAETFDHSRHTHFAC